MPRTPRTPAPLRAREWPSRSSHGAIAISTVTKGERRLAPERGAPLWLLWPSVGWASVGRFSRAVAFGRCSSAPACGFEGGVGDLGCGSTPAPPAVTWGRRWGVRPGLKRVTPERFCRHDDREALVHSANREAALEEVLGARQCSAGPALAAVFALLSSSVHFSLDVTDDEYAPAWRISVGTVGWRVAQRLSAPWLAAGGGARPSPESPVLRQPGAS